MSKIFEEVTINWQGEDYTIRPDYAMIQRIESRGISIAGVAHRMQKGEPPLSLVAEILAHLLVSAGCKTKPEDVYCELFELGDKEFSHIFQALLLAFTPQKKSQPRRKKAGKKRGKKSGT